METKYPYESLKEIYENALADQPSNWANNAIRLLQKNKIKLRQRDGMLRQVNISTPLSTSDALVLGLRYLKNDGTWTEDLFLFEQGKPVVPYYRGELEKVLVEYKDTHKRQLII